QAVLRDLAMAAGAIPRFDRASIESLPLRRLHAEGLARQVEVELELPRVDRAEEVERLAQVAVRMESVAIADQIAPRDHAIDRGADHQERPVELPAIEGDEARVVLEEVPELLQDLLLAAGDVRARSGLVDAQVGLSWNLVQRAGAPVLDVDHADGHDAPAKRREPSRTTRLLGVTLGETFDQIFADVR